MFLKTEIESIKVKSVDLGPKANVFDNKVEGLNGLEKRRKCIGARGQILKDLTAYH